jgi:hypothetical protein
MLRLPGLHQTGQISTVPKCQLIHRQTTADTFALFAGLSPAARYYCRVRGENSIEVGDFSDIVSFSTEASKTTVDQDGSIPRDYFVHQNYPNPFNPDTKIEFGLPATAYVVIKVFDALGREVATLENSTLVRGYYTRTWTPTALPSGMYFCRIQAGDFIEVKKMILMK